MKFQRLLQMRWFMSMLAGAAVMILSFGFMIGFFRFVGGTQGPGLWMIPILPGFIGAGIIESMTVRPYCDKVAPRMKYDERLSMCQPERPNAPGGCKEYQESGLANARCYLANKPPGDVIMNVINFLFYWGLFYFGMLILDSGKKRQSEAPKG